jgi:hypothetical protein
MSSGGTLTILIAVLGMGVFAYLWYTGKLCNIAPSVAFLCHKSGAQSFLDNTFAAGGVPLTPVEKTHQAGADLQVPGLVTTGPAAKFLGSFR